MRGAVLALLVPLFALGIRGTSTWKVQISRAATFQSLSVVAILGYLILMMSASRAMEIVGSDWSRFAQLSLIVVMTAATAPPDGRPDRRRNGWTAPTEAS